MLFIEPEIERNARAGISKQHNTLIARAIQPNDPGRAPSFWNSSGEGFIDGGALPPIRQVKAQSVIPLGNNLDSKDVAHTLDPRCGATLDP